MTKPTLDTIRPIELPGLDYLRNENTLADGQYCMYILAPDLTILLITEHESGLKFDYWESESILYGPPIPGDVLYDSWIATSEETAIGTLRDWIREVEV